MNLFPSPFSLFSLLSCFPSRFRQPKQERLVANLFIQTDLRDLYKNICQYSFFFSQGSCCEAVSCKSVRTARWRSTVLGCLGCYAVLQRIKVSAEGCFIIHMHKFVCWLKNYTVIRAMTTTVLLTTHSSCS